MNDLYIHQLETENKQLRIALQECRKALEEEITTKKKTIEYIKEHFMYSIGNDRGDIFFNDYDIQEIFEILGDKE